ncbi:MAG TPA: TM2 domain-containing protein [Pyrinomonadaceae bacterium]|nr:TM2 domain-containing protein [Pyrinomonadaceae bacterium]
MRYCTKCGGQNDDLAQYCAACQAPLGFGNVGYQPLQSVNPGQLVDWQKQGADKKLAAGLCGILLGGFGVHKFILGYTTEGIIEIVITFLTCGLGHFIGLIEGIIYLTKSDEEFVRTYIQGRKGWF